MIPSRLLIVFLLPLLYSWLFLQFVPRGLVEPAYTAVLVFVVAMFVLMLFDAVFAWRRSQPGRLHLRREQPARLSLGIDNEITLIVENRGSGRLRLQLRDLPPPTFPVSTQQFKVVVPGHRSVRITYQIKPNERGNFRFGDVVVRCQGPLSLAEVDRLIPLAQDVQVYPNLLEVRRYEAMVRSSLVQAGGYHSKRSPGGGREFSHYRDYTPDDDYRNVSWRATARRNKPITAVHESEHSQNILFCLDVGRMMAARVGDLTKLDHAINAILMLTHVSQTFQDNVGLLVFSHTVHLYLPPGRGRSQQAHFMQALYHVRPELVYANYREAFQHLISKHPKRALTMVFTDLLDDVVSQEYIEATALLRRFHLPLTLAVADVPLQQLAARSPENVGELYDVLTARELLHRRGELLRSLERQGALVLDTVPERLSVDAVNRYLSLKTSMRW
jgi:uncharacterized protein (DUF58 family)